MCIVIDTNTLASVFNAESTFHSNFKPVLDWIITGKGKIIYGGTKYATEIGKYLPLFSELNKLRKAIKLDDDKVDQKAQWASDLIQHKDFDDQHLIGLLKLSGCKLICSLDERAYKFFTHKQFFEHRRKQPRIYKGLNNRNLLRDSYITSICKPCGILKNKDKDLLISLLK